MQWLVLAAVSHREAAIDVIGSVEGVDTFICQKKVEIWSGDTNASLKDGQTQKDRATQLLRSRTGALVKQYRNWHEDKDIIISIQVFSIVSISIISIIRILAIAIPKDQSFPKS